MTQVCFAVPYHCGFCNVNDSIKCFTEDGTGMVHNGKVLFTPEQTEQANWLLVQDFEHNNFDEFYTKIPRARRIQLLNESIASMTYNLEYLEQFGIVISTYPIDGYTGDLVITNACLGWFAGTGFGRKDSIPPLFKNMRDAIDYNATDKKEKGISMVTSTYNYYKGHQLRIDFFKALKRHFGRKIDFYGKGVRAIDDKLEAIAPYKYTIVIENSREPNYWTEKLSDAWIGWSLPIYYGDPTILEQIPDPDGLVAINLDDFRVAFKAIENLLEEDLYYSRINAIKKCREWAIAKGNPYEKAAGLIELATEETFATPLLEKEELITPHPREEMIAERKNINYYFFRGLCRIFGEKNTSLLRDIYTKKVKKGYKKW
ncbi:MAG: hypothetical protein LBS45_03500 [Synergistaceae bacterium]|jgi:hypothetical protein|nr:hypothetical protein [Synergistaceae bacterium]